MLAISISKGKRKEIKPKYWLKKLSILDYIQSVLALMLITGILWTKQKMTELENKTWNLTREFDDTLYSLSKQLLVNNFSYDKQTNQIRLRHINGTGVELYFGFNMEITDKKNKSMAASPSLINSSSHSFYITEGKLLALNLCENKFTIPYKPIDLVYSNFELGPGNQSFLENRYFSANSSYNILYIKIKYKDHYGLILNPIRKLYITRDSTGNHIQPRLIVNTDSLKHAKAYLMNLNFW